MKISKTGTGLVYYLSLKSRYFNGRQLPCNDTVNNVGVKNIFELTLLPNYSVLFECTACFYTGVIPKSLSVLSTEPVLRKTAVDRGLRISTEQYGCRQRNDFIICAKSMLF